MEDEKVSWFEVAFFAAVALACIYNMLRFLTH